MRYWFLLLNLAGFFISTRSKWSVGNVLYHWGSSSEVASRGDEPFYIFAWFIGSGGLIQMESTLFGVHWNKIPYASSMESTTKLFRYLINDQRSTVFSRRGIDGRCRYRPYSPVGGSTVDVDINRDWSTGRVKKHRPIDDTCAKFDRMRCPVYELVRTIK